MQGVAAILAICHMCASGEQDGTMSTTSTPSLRPTKVDDVGRTCEDEFGSFVRKFEKHYDSPEEEEIRRNIFCDRLAWIKKRNSENHEYTVGVTPFADLSPDEFRSTYGMSAKYMNASISEIWGGLEEVNDHSLRRSTAAPSSVDWRREGAVSAVQNQGKCGSCWTFATAGALEGAWKVFGGALYVLSTQQLLDCADEDYGNSGCKGGWTKRAIKYIEDEGLCRAQDYSYKGFKGTCQASNCTQVIPPTKVLGAFLVEHYDYALMQAVTQQPVAVNINGHSEVFQLYEGGIIGPDCGILINHAVLLVGYGTDQGTPYWIIKNSWGILWGEAGFGRLQRGVSGTGECGILSGPVYPILVKPAPPPPPSHTITITTITTITTATTTGSAPRHHRCYFVRGIVQLLCHWFLLQSILQAPPTRAAARSELAGIAGHSSSSSNEMDHSRRPAGRPGRALSRSFDLQCSTPGLPGPRSGHARPGSTGSRADGFGRAIRPLALCSNASRRTRKCQCRIAWRFMGTYMWGHK
ncbi:RD21A [Symbiodinium sp. CCMP2592]|nr:RD21A [Symbiodinium sp. CCMP2592]